MRTNQNISLNNKKLLTGLFKDRNSAEGAYQSALNHGYQPNEINIMMSDDVRKKHFIKEDSAMEISDKSLQGMGVGSALGGTVGGIVAAIAAMGTSLVIPGLGIMIAGPLAAGLAGIGAGGLAGGVLGTLAGIGIPEEDAKVYEEGIKSGDILMSVNTRTEQERLALENDWKKHNVQRIMH